MTKTPTIEDALEFLAGYHRKNIGNPTPRLSAYDQPGVNNLASKSLCGKAFSQKQGKLAFIFVKKYKNQLRRGGIEIDLILSTKEFRRKTIAAIPSILCFEKENDNTIISLSFPYNARLIKLMHTRNHESQSSHYPHRFEWDGNDKKWTAKVFIDNFEFAYKIAFENRFYIEPIVEEYAKKIADHRLIVQIPKVRVKEGELVFTSLFNQQKIHLERQFNVS